MDCRGSFCERTPEAAPMSGRASSKTNPLLVKVEPISDTGSTSVITYLRKGKKHCTTAAARREQ